MKNAPLPVDLIVQPYRGRFDRLLHGVYQLRSGVGIAALKTTDVHGIITSLTTTYAGLPFAFHPACELADVVFIKDAVLISDAVKSGAIDDDDFSSIDRSNG